MFTQRPRIDLIYADLSSARRSSIVSLDACACILPEPGVLVYLSHCSVQLISHHPQQLAVRPTVSTSTHCPYVFFAFDPRPMLGESWHFLGKLMPSFYQLHFLSPPVFSEHIWPPCLGHQIPAYWSIDCTNTSSTFNHHNRRRCFNPLQLLCTSCPEPFILLFSSRCTATPLFSCHSCSL